MVLLGGIHCNVFFANGQEAIFEGRAKNTGMIIA